MRTRIVAYPKEGRQWYKAQRRFLGFWIDRFAHPTRWFVITTFASTNKADVTEFITKVKGK